jgi:hypothetical protein
MFIANFLKNKQNTSLNLPIVLNNFLLLKCLYSCSIKKKLKINFLKKSITVFKVFKFIKKMKKINFFLFLNKFLLNFLEFFLKSRIIFNLKKGSNKLILNQISSRKFFLKYFKKNLKISKQILGIVYYSLLLKDSFIFVNFFKKVLEKLNVKLHKKVFLGLKKLLKDIFKPIFNFLGVYGVFFNIKGKIGVSGNAKKRRYYFYYGKHSITNKSVKFDIKYTPVWTFTGSLGFTFLIFF